MKPNADIVVKLFLQMSLRELRAIRVVLDSVIEHVEIMEALAFQAEMKKKNAHSEEPT